MDTWSPLAVVDVGAPGPVADVAVASVGDDVELVAADTTGPLRHAVLGDGARGRHADACPFAGDPGTPSRVTLTGP
ncbi:hypothetical protein [Lentzea sp. NBRC 102530]|uniref:hypothetical protein n=1 Tax=Lentzea sp. NBRC 102530 TaxID=3032201 RepID=UPI00249FAABD|nr:hypothetical protein [Lentzea sp. NBRC 102530]GLY50301.1 hypothetical protein Lesp01_39570 [Lentzea sp. NBRC 102530]